VFVLNKQKAEMGNRRHFKQIGGRGEGQSVHRGRDFHLINKARKARLVLAHSR
jgi:hypothetical protein